MIRLVHAREKLFAARPENAFPYLDDAAVKTLLRMFRFGYPMRRQTIGEELAVLCNLDCVECVGKLFALTETGVNTVAAYTCRSPAHKPGQCWGLVDDCPLCGTPHCYEDGCADDADCTMPNICDTCAQGAEFDDRTRPAVDVG